MLTDVLNSIKNELIDAGVTNVYTIFDALPIEKKGKNFFTVVGISSFETSSPIYGGICHHPEAPSQPVGGHCRTTQTADQ